MREGIYRCVPFYDHASSTVSPTIEFKASLTDSVGVKYPVVKGVNRDGIAFVACRACMSVFEIRGGRKKGEKEEGRRLDHPWSLFVRQGALSSILSVNLVWGHLRRSCGEFLAKRGSADTVPPFTSSAVPKAAIYMSCGEVSTAWRALRFPKRILRASHKERGWTLLLLGCATSGHVEISMFR